jgi:hypothetical protein
MDRVAAAVVDSVGLHHIYLELDFVSADEVDLQLRRAQLSSDDPWNRERRLDQMDDMMELLPEA